MIWTTLILMLVGHPLYESIEYSWPTEASRAMTSSFAESRPGRFHAGIDIKTWGREGYPVFAIRPGYISRIRVSPYGYGRALYLTLDTGEVVVYGHLQKFNEAIEQHVRGVQNRRGRFSVQIYPKADQFRVTQGELIGYTGATGVGYPHLHFELRDRSNRAINPLLKGYQLKDSIAPVVRRVALSPLDALSMVENDWRTEIRSLLRTAPGKYRLERPVSVSGRIGFSVSAYDQMDGISNKFGVYRHRLVISGQEFFRAQYDRFSYEENHLARLDRNYRLFTQGLGYFYCLYRERGNTLDFYPDDQLYYGVVNIQADSMILLPSDLRTLAPGEHEFTIELEDFWGNRSSVTGRLLAGPMPLLRLEADPQQRMLRLAADGLGQLEQCGIDLSMDHLNFKRLASGSPPLQFDMQPAGETRTVRAVGRDTLGRAVPPVFLVFNGESGTPELDLQTEFYDHFIRIECRSNIPLVRMPHLSGRCTNGGERTLKTVAQSTRQFRAVWPLSGAERGPLILTFRGVDPQGQPWHHTEPIFYHTVNRNQTRRLVSNDGFCAVEFSRNSLFNTIYLRFESQNSDLEALSGSDSKKLDFVGRIYTLHPEDVPLNRGVTLHLRYPDDDPGFEKLGLYRLQGKGGRWSFQGNRLDRSDHTISASVTQLGTWALIRDTEAPSLLSLSPGQNVRLNSRRPRLQARFRDALSGIYGEENMQLVLDGRVQIAEYDPDRQLLFCRPQTALSPGRHKLTCVIKDRCGNSTSRTHMFWIE